MSLTVTQYSKMGEGDLAPEKLRPYASIMPGGVNFGKATTAPMDNGMGVSGAQPMAAPTVAPAATPSFAGKSWSEMTEAERMAHSQKWGTDYAKSKSVAPAVQPGQAVFGDPNPPNPAAVSGPAPTAPVKRPKPDPVADPMSNYDDYIDRAFGYATRTLEPMIEREQSRFDQEMINRGIAPGNEAFMLAEDEMTRGHNDLLTSAAFQAMGFGNQLQQQDRQYGLQRDTFDLNELSTIDSINRAWNDNAYRDAVFNTSREDQQFNQMLSLFGMTPVGSTQPFNMGQAFSNQYNADLNAQLINNNMWSQVGTAAQEAVPAIFDAWNNRNSGG